MAKILVVVGATGSQGLAVISWFQRHEPTWRIRGLTRTPSSISAQALARSGVEIVQADLDSTSSLETAFDDAQYIFAYTDWHGILQSPAVMGRPEARGADARAGRGV